MRAKRHSVLFNNKDFLNFKKLELSNEFSQFVKAAFYEKINKIRIKHKASKSAVEPIL